MFSPRDRFFAELIVARGLATADQVRASLTSTGAEEPGMLSRYLVAGRVIDEERRLQLEGECDRWKRSCACGEVFYSLAQEASCPRCGRSVSAGSYAVTNLDLGSAAPSPTGSADLVPGDASFQPRSRFGPYRVEGELGRGGMGVVYRAIQEPIGRKVAIKVLLEPRGKRRERFIREARAAARLEHPSIVRIHDVGEEEGVAFYSMELVEGEPLDRILLSRGKLPVERALSIVEEIARAVEHAHGHRILHRDLKPGNILITKVGKPVLIDFGLARALDDDDQRLTRSGVAIGTPHYMSPEQVRGLRAEIDERTDVWALGVILFELLAGERPFKGDTTTDLYAAIQLGDPPSIRSLVPEVLASVATIIAKALEREKEKRYRSAVQLADEIGRALRGDAPDAAAFGERVRRSARRVVRRVRKLSLVLVALASMTMAAFVVNAVLSRRDRDQLAATGQAERGRVKALATELETRERARATSALQTDDPRAARLAAEEAVAALDSLEDLLARNLTTDAGRAEAHAQAATPEALSALGEALVARARVALRGSSEGGLELAQGDLARARLRAPDDVELAALHASTLCALERPEDAAASLAAALAAHPLDPLLVLRRGEVELLAGARERGLALVESAVAARPGDPAFKLARARARLRAGNPGGALADAKEGRDADSILLALEAELALGDGTAAGRSVRELGEKRGPEDPLALEARAVLAHARGDDEGEERALSRLLARRPDDAELLAARARARILRLDADGASDLRAAAEHARSPRRRVRLRIELAELEDALGRPEDGTRDLERALAAAKEDALARGLVNLARARRSLMGLVAPASAPGCGPPDGAAARAALADAFRESPSVAGLGVARAWLAIEQAKDDPGGAAREALHLLDAAPPDPLAASVEIEARRLGGQRALDAVESRQVALEDAATDLAGELERRALDDMGFAPYASASEQGGVWERCFKRAAWAVALAPRRAGAASIAAGAQLELRNLEASRRYLACARSWNERHPLVLLWQGLSALRAKDGKGAASSLSAALSLEPETRGSEARLWQQLADACLVARDADGAEKAARKVLELEPSSRAPLELLLQAARVRGDQAAIDSAESVLLADKDGPRRAAMLELNARETSSEREVSLLEEASRLAPREPAVFCSLCFARFRHMDMLGAWRAWMRALELAPYFGRFDLEECGYIGTERLRQLGNGGYFADAVAALQEREPRAAEVHFLAAWVGWTRSELPGEDRAALRDRAISDLDRALAVDRRFSIAWALRGHLRALRGEVGTARSDLDRALQVRADRMPIAHVYRASLHASLGETEAAFGELELASRQGFQDRGRFVKLPGLEALRDDPRYRSLFGRLTDAPVTGFSEGF